MNTEGIVPPKARDVLNRMRVPRTYRKKHNLPSSSPYTYADWNTLCFLYGKKCLSCGIKGVLLTRDHVIPISKGGTDTLDNLQPLCSECNKAKDNETGDYRPYKVNLTRMAGATFVLTP